MALLRLVRTKRPAGMHYMPDPTVRVSYLELTQSPAPSATHIGTESVAREKLRVGEYLDLYKRVGGPVRWDQRLGMPRADLTRLLESDRSQIHVLRDGRGQALGFCEFERCLPEIELKNFGLVPTAQGKGLGSWLLRTPRGWFPDLHGARGTAWRPVRTDAGRSQRRSSA